jgi:hypothetical protein
VRRRTYGLLLSLLAVLFLARVAGQALVAFLDVPWLPPMDVWYSGLLSYPLLLPSQVTILLVQAKISLDLVRGHGVFLRPGRRAGRLLRLFGLLYLAAMLARYVLTMAWYPERRWLGAGTIPTAFHVVLAVYVLTLARFYLRREEA